MSTPPTHPLPPKKEVALALLERSSVHLHLDPRVDGVVVPPWFKKQAQLVLQIGLNMPVPIPDLRLDEEGMSCTLSFSRSPFFCVVPWTSVFAMVGEDGRGMVWPDDVPPEVARQAQAQARKEAAKSEPRAEQAPAAAPKSKKPKKKPLAAVASPEPAPSEARPTPPRPVAVPTPPPSQPASSRPSTAGPPKKKRELPPYLRVVK
jgi:stringent starvation protein B